jgi:hypothetical protein
MVRTRRRPLAMVVLVAALAGASSASAGPFGWIFPNESQPNSYTPWYTWAPRAERVHDLHGPKLDVYPPDRHPEITPEYNILRFPCPAVDPAATLIERASPPASSKFRY